jgi:hypothetical protein
MALMIATGLWSANALARSPDSDSRWLPKAIFPLVPASRPEARLPLLLSLRFADRAGLASVSHRSTSIAIGAATLSLFGNRFANIAQRYDRSAAIDRWSLRDVGADVRTGILDGVDLSLSGEYAVMKRRHEILEITPRRLSTMITRFGAALLFGSDRRLALDYVTVARGAGQNDLVRMAQTVGGVPLTGHGPELSFETGSPRLGSASWRLALSSMHRDPLDLGLGDTGTHGVTDARLSLGLRLGL